MKYTPYPNGYAHFMALLVKKLASKGLSYSKEFYALEASSIGHINSEKILNFSPLGKSKKVGDLFVLKGIAEQYETYLVTVDELDASRNKVYVVNEDDDGIAPTAEELACVEEIRNIAGDWGRDVITSLENLIIFGWHGFYNDGDVNETAEKSNMVAEKTWFHHDREKTKIKIGVHSFSNQFMISIAAGSHYKRFEFLYDPRDAEDYDPTRNFMFAAFGTFNSELDAHDQDGYYKCLANWFEYVFEDEKELSHTNIINDTFEWSVKAMGSEVKLMKVVA